jgi:hypothetical protein
MRTIGRRLNSSVGLTGSVDARDIIAILNHDEASAKLRVVRHRLEGALERFYSLDLSGDAIALEAAALDICIPIRVLVHDYKRRSIALLREIDASYLSKPIHFRPLIAEQPRTLPSGVQTMTVAIPVNVSLRVGDAATRSSTFTRYQGDTNPASRVPMQSWWFGTCWNSGTNELSNKDLVLSLANKEGGAHVDADLSPNYSAAKNQGHIMIGRKPVSDLARLGSLVGIAGDELLEHLRENYPDPA